MFWPVGASGYHQDREKQHKSFHNELHNILASVHPKIRDSPMEMSVPLWRDNQQSVQHIVFTCDLPLADRAHLKTAVFR